MAFRRKLTNLSQDVSKRIDETLALTKFAVSHGLHEVLAYVRFRAQVCAVSFLPLQARRPVLASSLPAVRAEYVNHGRLVTFASRLVDVAEACYCRGSLSIYNLQEMLRAASACCQCNYLAASAVSRKALQTCHGALMLLVQQ